MIPERAVWSPTAVILTRRLPPLATVPAITLEPDPFGRRFGLAGYHRLVNVGRALNNRAICRNAGSGPDKNDVADAQLRERNRFSVCALYTFGGVWKKSGERIEGSARLGNSSHFEPVT